MMESAMLEWRYEVWDRVRSRWVGDMPLRSLRDFYGLRTEALNRIVAAGENEVVLYGNGKGWEISVTLLSSTV